MSASRRKTDPAGEAAPDDAAPRRRRRQSLRRTFCDGIEVAVQAEPSAFRATRPRTMLSLMVRELVSVAARGRSDAIKAVMGYLDEAELRAGAAESEGAPSQGNSCAQSLPEPLWEWSDGSWDSSEREKTEAQADAAGESSFERLYARFMRAREAELENAAREERRATERDGAAAPPEQRANSGTVSPAGPQIHIAGRVANG